MQNAKQFLCSFCNQPVELENARTDETGQVIHPECYLAKMRGKQPPLPEASGVPE